MKIDLSPNNLQAMGGQTWPPDDTLAELLAHPDVSLPTFLTVDESEAVPDNIVVAAQIGQLGFVQGMLKRQSGLLAARAALDTEHQAVRAPAWQRVFQAHEQIVQQLAALWQTPERLGADFKTSGQLSPADKQALVEVDGQVSNALLGAEAEHVLLAVVPDGHGEYLTVRPFAWGNDTATNKILQRSGENGQQYRLVINPSLDQVAIVAARIVRRAADRPETVFHFKLADAFNPGMGQRTDKIVIYCSDAELQGVGDILSGVREDTPQAFTDRILPRDAFPLVDESDQRTGIGIVKDRQNRTISVALALGSALRMVETRDAAREQQVAAMRLALAKTALEYGISPHNLAF